MKKLNLIIIASGMVLLLANCLKEKAAHIIGPCDANTVYFAKDVQPILNSNCAMSGCHDSKRAAEGYDFSSYQTTMDAVRPGNPNNSKLYEVIHPGSHGAKMPPKGYPALDSLQLATIYKWIQQGASNDLCSDLATTCDTSNVKFSNTVSPVIKNNCEGCHNSSNASAGVDLSTYSNISSVATSGRLMGAINFAAGYKAMLPSGTQLSACDRQKLQHWIDLGMKNN